MSSPSRSPFAAFVAAVSVVAAAAPVAAAVIVDAAVAVAVPRRRR